jgi:guanylate kinase
MDVVLDIDWQGAQQVRKILPDVHTIFILPPSKVELEQRLNKRGQDSQETIAGRMAQAQSETSHYNEYDFVIVNNNFEIALADIETIVMAQRLRVKAQTIRHQDLLNSLLK